MNSKIGKKKIQKQVVNLKFRKKSRWTNQANGIATSLPLVAPRNDIKKILSTFKLLTFN